MSHNKDQTFVAFMTALGFTYHDHAGVSSPFWQNREYKISIFDSQATPEKVITEYTNAVRKTSKENHQQYVRDTLFDLMGLSTTDIHGCCDRTVANDVVRIDKW